MEPTQAGAKANLASLVLTVHVAPGVDGKDHVSCYTMSGDMVFSKAYGYFERCRLFEYRELVKEALGRSASPVQLSNSEKGTKVEFVLGEKKLRGNAVLSRGPPNHITLGDRMWRTVNVRQHWIHRYRAQ